MGELSKKGIGLSVKLPPNKAAAESSDHLGGGLRDLYRNGLFTDVALRCEEQTFRAHRAVLASQSDVFKEQLASGSTASGPSSAEIRLADVSNPEAVKFMLDHMYQMDLDNWQDYNPRTQEINKDVLRLAQSYKLPGLTQRATLWLAKDLTTGNVVERLKICDDFGLETLRERILEQLTLNKRALAEVANSPQIMSYPKLMQAMLQLAASVPEEPPAPAPAAASSSGEKEKGGGQPPKKKGRKA